MKLLRFTYRDTICEMDHLGQWELVQGGGHVQSALDFLMFRFEIEPGRAYGGMVEGIQAAHRRSGVMRAGKFEVLEKQEIPPEEEDAIF